MGNSPLIVNPLITKLTFSLTRKSVIKFFHVNGLN